MTTQQGRNQRHPHYIPRSILFWSCSALMAAGLLVNVALPGVAQSQINGRVVSAPQVGAAQAQAAKPKLPKAPAQVAMPAPPPMRIVPGLEEPLVAVGKVTDEENKDLDATLAAFRAAPAKAGPGGDFDDYAGPLLSFIAAHRESNWNAALQLNLGLGYYHAGYFSRAFAAYEKAWQAGRNATTPQARLMVDRAVGELAKMHARVGHDKELGALFKDIGKRPIGGPATELLQGAREGLWDFRHQYSTAYLCGPQALKNVLVTLEAKPQQIKVAEDARSGPHGFSLTQLAALADKAKLKYSLIKRKPGEPIPVPSIINWNIHHYAAILGYHDGFYLIADPTFGGGGMLTVSAKAIDAEGSGYFLVPAQAMSAKAGWRAVSPRSAEAKAVYGMGSTTNNVPLETNCKSCHMNAAGPVKVTELNAPGAAPVSHGMTTVNAHTMVVSLNLSDTPVGYAPQKGPAAFTTLTYNSREASQPANFGYSNVGPKWTLNWIDFIQDTPTGFYGLPGFHASGGGGGETHVFYSAQSGVHADLWANAQLFRFPAPTGPATSYEQRRPDGSKDVYAKFDGATTAPRNIFITKRIDPQGNVMTFNYDSSLRLTSVVDAMGRSTTFSYGIPASPLLITRITDPFGRAAQLTYDASGRLATITDAAGITTSFTYSTPEPTFVTGMTTPYGTSAFSDTVDPGDPVESNTRSLTMTDPLGFTDYLYYYPNPAIVPSTDPAATVPTGMTPAASNTLLQFRNTFHWDKHAFALGVTMSGGVVTAHDYSKANITHWLHYLYDVNQTGMVPESIKPPLEHRIWFNYPQQSATYLGPTLNQATSTARVLDDGTTQNFKAVWNPAGNLLTSTVAGNLLSTTDPKGRATKYNWASNNQDLLTVQQLTTAPSTYTTIAAFGSYNTQHEPLTYTDAAGQVWHFTWNAAGQPATVTDPSGGVTTRNYDTSGRLSTIVNANSQTILTLTYDAFDRVLTRTDSEGLTLTYAYDSLDRITSVTYPDGTTELYDYSFQSGPNIGTPSLELRKHTDRLGRVTTRDYDADQRVISVTEPTSGTATRTTSYSYYEDGTLKELLDANGNVTHWDIDIESRPVKKTYAFGTSAAQAETYTYENTTSRLKSITDANGQVKSFTYDIDDKVKGITYTNTVNPTPNVTFTWDTIFPRLSSMADGLGTTSFAYAPIGTPGALKLSSIDGPFSNDVIGLTYDALGRLAGRTITGGNETFTYDPISRLTTHGTPLGSFTNTYLGQTSQPASRSVTNGIVTVSTNWGYDTNANDRRLISIANSGVTRSYALSYLDPATSAINPYDIMGITDTAATGHPYASQSHGYGYDNVDRLLSATSTTPGNYSYGYDNLDNATSVTDPGFGSTSPTYNGLNQVQTFNTNTYTYDNNGNTTSDGLTKTYKWDAENRLIEIDYTGTSNKSVFSYDGLGHRTTDAETISGTTTTTRFLWCGSRICQTRDGSDVVQSRILDEGELNVVSGQKAVYMQDQLGSVRDVLDATTGSLISSIDYSPYGNPVATNGTFVPLYQYAGLMHHPQSGLNFGMFRAQDGITGRLINRDPIREWGGPNPYAYAGANPVNYLDPLGLAMTIARPLPMPPGSLIGRVIGGTIEAFGAGAEGIGLIFWPSDTASPSEDEPAGSCPEPGDIEGKTPDEVGDIMKGKGWTPSPTNSQDGTRWDNPDVKGQQVRTMPGGPSSIPVKNGPYGVISNGNGPPVRVPLAGNPTLSR